MSARLIDFLLSRTARERVLLGALMLICLPLLLAFAVVIPLQEARAQAQSEHQEARALGIWVSERVAELNTFGDAPDVVRSAPIGSSGLEQSLIDAGLRDQISDLGVGDAGVIELRFDLVRFVTLANWISANKPTWGYDITSFRFEATNASGRVSATLSLAPQS
ncbi:type II secretion system protein GspM [Sulfitobacter aestuariivivens]|uniref:Type II secretion system protein M n=1 Tax=Sulfitobacter aestuariivivens TaxID=2766981 RepID=A0A927HEM7_9RHOB|nr:type II secretion system protein GspM [Sulfitobacter aestuariivivens]MBD3664942.1 type II secretion system protein M [Sulfitobacter aestuariivivens]